MKTLQDYEKIRALAGWLLRNRRFQARRAALRGCDYLQIGCGPQVAPGFVNLDYRWVPGVDVVWDLVRPLPFAPNRFRGIFTEHCLEHFDESRLAAVLRELWRVLAPGGRLRVVVPSLEIHAGAYLAALAAPTAPAIEQSATPAHAVNRVFYSGHEQMGRSRWVNDGHHFMHDFGSMAAFLRAAGFTAITSSGFKQGADPALLIDRADRAWESLYVEAIKPIPMKIFGNCLVKNEDDMIVETLVHAARWCDRIFVFDNGSTDDTWKKVLALAAREPRVVPFQSAAVPYRDSLRKETFNRYRAECAEGDWWCKLDADELYYDDPREFLAAVPRRHHVVWGVNFQFYFTDADAARWEQDPQAYPPHAPAEQALRYYRCDYSEVRFFRYRRRLTWDAGSAPRHLGVVHPRRIRFKHYQYRSPQQIELRLRTRQQAMAEGCGTFQGYNEENSWRQKVVPAASCHSMDEPNPLQIEESKLPRHVEPLATRAAKLFMHGTGLWP